MRMLRVASFALASLALPAVALASTPTMSAAFIQPDQNVTTGITPVRVTQTQWVRMPGALPTDEMPKVSKFLIHLKVSKDGMPEDLHMIHSSDPLLDNSVIASVSDFRFDPAHLDHHDIRIPVNLTVLLHR
jgi:Gram-negative bacterial TonB protein C-terminal